MKYIILPFRLMPLFALVILVLGLIFLIRPAKAEKGFLIEGYVTKGIYLYDASSNRTTPLKGKPVPNRVHVRWSDEFNDWVFVLADRWSRFASPMEVLLAGSIVPGEMLSAGPGNYQFLPGPVWVETEEVKKMRFVVLDKIPRLKVVSFKPVGEQVVEFVNPEYQPKLDAIYPLAFR